MFSTFAETRPSGIPPAGGLLPYASQRDPDMGEHLQRLGRPPHARLKGRGEGLLGVPHLPVERAFPQQRLVGADAGG